MKNDKTLFTVYTTVHNEEEYIAECICSVLNQSYDNFEFLIINDGSTDNTHDEIKKFLHDERITYINKKKLGKVAAINNLWQSMRGDWGYFMGGDDRMPDNALELWHRHTKSLDSNKMIALCGEMITISEDPKYNGLKLPKNKTRRNWSGPLALLSSGAISAIGDLPECLPNEDTYWGIWLETFAEEKVKINEVIINYRFHSGNAISRGQDFSTFNKSYGVRMTAFSKFKKAFDKDLSNKQKRMLDQKIEIEKFRSDGRWVNILFAKGPFVHKIRNILFSNKHFYKIKMLLDTYLIGW